MKTKPTSSVTARLHALGLIAAILSPGMVLAKPASSTIEDSPKSRIGKPHPAQKVGPLIQSVPTVRFNMVDGQPIK